MQAIKNWGWEFLPSRLESQRHLHGEHLCLACKYECVFLPLKVCGCILTKVIIAHSAVNCKRGNKHIYKSSALREWESCSWNSTEAYASAYVSSFLLHLCQRSKWFSCKSVWLVFRKSWVRIPAGSQNFFLWIYFSLSQHNTRYSCDPRI